MRTAPSTIKDVITVYENLSAQNRAEHEVMGLDRWAILRKAHDFMRKGSAYTGLVDGEPVVVFGVFKDNGENATWFLGTDKYFSLGLNAIRHARRFLRGIWYLHGRLITGSCSPHPDVDRWFKVLGYEKIDEIDGVKWFVYDAPARQASVTPEIAAPGSPTTAQDDVFRQ